MSEKLVVVYEIPPRHNDNVNNKKKNKCTDPNDKYWPAEMTLTAVAAAVTLKYCGKLKKSVIAGRSRRILYFVPTTGFYYYYFFFSWYISYNPCISIKYKYNVFITFTAALLITLNAKECSAIMIVPCLHTRFNFLGIYYYMVRFSRIYSVRWYASVQALQVYTRNLYFMFISYRVRIWKTFK